MSASRRDVLKLASAGIGSYAALDVGASNAEGFWFKRKSVPIGEDTNASANRGVEILITSMSSGSDISHSFSVYGTYSLVRKDGLKLRSPDSISCFLTDNQVPPNTLATGQTSWEGDANGGDWVSDFSFTNPASGDGLKIFVIMTIGTNSFHATIVDLRLLVQGGEPVVVTIPNRDDRKKFENDPAGTVHKGEVFVISSEYIESGTLKGSKKIGGKRIGKRNRTIHSKTPRSWGHKDAIGSAPTTNRNASFLVKVTYMPEGEDQEKFFCTSVQKIKG